MPNTTLGDLDSRLQKEESYIKLWKIIIYSTFQQDNPHTDEAILTKYRTSYISAQRRELTLKNSQLNHA